MSGIHQDRRQIELARTMLGLQTHGHHAPLGKPADTHFSPHQQRQGWWPAGTGPFRPGPGAPMFGARMPMTHRPGVSFGPQHHAKYNPGHGYGWQQRGVYDFSPPEHTPVGISGVGSQQRWWSVTHRHGPMNVSGKLSQPEVQELRAMMIAALGSTRSARPTDPGSAAAKLVAAQIANQGSAQARLQNLFRKASPQTSAKADLERILFLAPAAAAAAQAVPMPFGGHKMTPGEEAVYQAQQAAAMLWGKGSGSSPSGGGSGSGYGASVDVNLNVPTPSLPPPPSASAKGSISF